MKNLSFVLVTITLALMVQFAAPAYAQPNSPEDVLRSVLNAQHAFIEKKIDKVRAEIELWKRDWHLLVFLTAMVAAFGVLSAGMQAWASTWVKIATATMGIVVGIITGTTAIIFPEDHRTLRLKILEAEGPLEEIEYRLREDHFGRNLEERKALLNELIQKFQVIDKLQQAP
jgi:hypothetical protein